MRGIIAFDMDGTIVDLYSVSGWLDDIHNENPRPYVEAKPLWDMEKLNEILNKLIDSGWEIRVISWLAGGSSEEYNKAVRAAKIWWLNFYGFPYKRAHLVAYGTTKADCIWRITQNKPAILVDDNDKVRHDWHLGQTIDPTYCNLYEELEKLI